jgi:hypothetical protein
MPTLPLCTGRLEQGGVLGKLWKPAAGPSVRVLSRRVGIDLAYDPEREKTRFQQNGHLYYVEFMEGTQP